MLKFTKAGGDMVSLVPMVKDSSTIVKASPTTKNFWILLERRTVKKSRNEVKKIILLFNLPFFTEPIANTDH